MKNKIIFILFLSFIFCANLFAAENYFSFESKSIEYKDDKDIIIADLPGLIEGASDGVGLGHKFLAHVERCKLIIHLCDLSCENSLLVKNYKLIRKELEKYGEITGLKKEILILNKSDLVDKEETLKKINILKKLSGSDPILISCVDNSGIIKLIEFLYETVK